jgi:hypothetical protein
MDIFTDPETPARRHRFVIYLPTKRKDGESIEGFEQLAMAAEALICERLGGVTSYPARGAFQGKSSNIQREQVQVLETYCDEAHWAREARYLSALAQVLARELDQESVACSLDGVMALVTPDESLLKHLPNLGTCTPETLNSLIGKFIEYID